MIESYRISDEAFRFIISESANGFPNETGGLLVGKVENSIVFIQHAAGAGPAAHHGPSSFKRDGDFSQEALDNFVQVSDGEFDYIGEWHSHPFKSLPSYVDLESMKWIAANKKYAIKQPVMLLCLSTGLNSWEICCYVLIRNRLRLLSPAT
jgi:integrative and conjugative element protein (TIGR02256 family)